MPNVRKGTLINTTMDKTFPDRRKFLLAQIRTVTDMKHEYPLLFTYEQVQKQFVFCFYLNFFAFQGYVFCCTYMDITLNCFGQKICFPFS